MTAMALGDECPRIVVDGLDLTTEPWSVEDLRGWGNGGASVVRSSTKRPDAHGEFGQRVWRGGRLVTITGQVDAGEHRAAHAVEDRLAMLAAGGEFVTMAVTEFGRTLWVPVQLAEPPDVTWESDRLWTYTLQLWSPSSFRYGDTSSDSTGFAVEPAGAGLVFPMFSPAGVLDYGVPATSLGTVTVTNHGTAPASVVFAVDGPTPVGGFVIADTATGRRIRYLAVVPDGGRLVLDGRDATVRLDGIDRMAHAVIEAWPTLDPGEARAFSFEPLIAPSASPTLTASVTDTYW